VRYRFGSSWDFPRAVMIHDQAGPALSSIRRPNPLQEDTHALAGLRQKLQVYEPPGQPRQETVHPNLAGLQHGEASTHYCHIALIKVVKSRRTGLAGDSTCDQTPGVPALLDGNLGDPR
jgi:hypothetical protein